MWYVLWGVLIYWLLVFLSVLVWNWGEWCDLYDITFDFSINCIWIAFQFLVQNWGVCMICSWWCHVTTWIGLCVLFWISPIRMIILVMLVFWLVISVLVSYLFKNWCVVYGRMRPFFFTELRVGYMYDMLGSGLQWRPRP